MIRAEAARAPAPALMFPGDHPYVVVVLSSGTDEDGALASMTAISRLTYQFTGGLPAVTRTLKH